MAQNRSNETLTMNASTKVAQIHSPRVKGVAKRLVMLEDQISSRKSRLTQRLARLTNCQKTTLKSRINEAMFVPPCESNPKLRYPKIKISQKGQ